MYSPVSLTHPVLNCCWFPQDFESSVWPLHFAPNKAYSFAAAVLDLLPEVREVQHAHRRAKSSLLNDDNPYPFYGAVYGLKRGKCSLRHDYYVCSVYDRWPGSGSKRS